MSPESINLSIIPCDLPFRKRRRASLPISLRSKPIPSPPTISLRSSANPRVYSASKAGAYKGLPGPGSSLASIPMTRRWFSAREQSSRFLQCLDDPRSSPEPTLLPRSPFNQSLFPFLRGHAVVAAIPYTLKERLRTPNEAPPQRWAFGLGEHVSNDGRNRSRTIAHRTRGTRANRDHEEVIWVNTGDPGEEAEQ